MDPRRRILYTASHRGFSLTRPYTQSRVSAHSSLESAFCHKSTRNCVVGRSDDLDPICLRGALRPPSVMPEWMFLAKGSQSNHDHQPGHLACARIALHNSEPTLIYCRGLLLLTPPLSPKPIPTPYQNMTQNARLTTLITVSYNLLNRAKTGLFLPNRDLNPQPPANRSHSFSHTPNFRLPPHIIPRCETP